MIERFLPVAASQHAADLDRVLFGIHGHMAIQARRVGTVLRLRARALSARRDSRSRRPRDSGPLLPILAIGAVIAGDAILLATSALPAWLCAIGSASRRARAARGPRGRGTVRVEHPLPGSGWPLRADEPGA